MIFCRCYLRFLYSAAIEWTENESTEILDLAAKYGPVELVACCKSFGRQSPATNDSNSENKDSEDVKVVAESKASLSGETGQYKLESLHCGGMPEKVDEKCNLFGTQEDVVDNVDQKQIADGKTDYRCFARHNHFS